MDFKQQCYSDNMNYKFLTHGRHDINEERFKHCGAWNHLKYFKVPNDRFGAYIYFGKCKKCGKHIMYYYGLMNHIYDGDMALTIFKGKILLKTMGNIEKSS